MLAVNKTRVVEQARWAEVLPGLAQLTEPVIFKGMVTHWPLVQAGLKSSAAAMDYLLARYAGREVTCCFAAPESRGRFTYNEEATGLSFSSARTHLPVVFDNIKQHMGNDNAPLFYVGSTTVETCFPGLSTDNDLVFEPLRPLVSIWMGNRSVVSAHFDAPDNIACCAIGRRRFTLFPPHQLENLYVGPLHLTPAGQSISLVDFANPDFEKYPRFAEALAHGQVAELEPGDALFIPSMWWHHVDSLAEFNVLVNYWWRDDQSFMDPPLDALMHAILSIRDLPAKEKAAWKNLFDFYVFSEQKGKYDHIPEKGRGFLAPLNEALARRLRSWLLNRLNK